MAKHKKILNITMLDGDADGGLECCLKPGDAYLYRGYHVKNYLIIKA